MKVTRSPTRILWRRTIRFADFLFASLIAMSLLLPGTFPHYSTQIPSHDSVETDCQLIACPTPTSDLHKSNRPNVARQVVKVLMGDRISPQAHLFQTPMTSRIARIIRTHRHPEIYSQAPKIRPQITRIGISGIQLAPLRDPRFQQCQTQIARQS